MVSHGVSTDSLNVVCLLRGVQSLTGLSRYLQAHANNSGPGGSQGVFGKLLGLATGRTGQTSYPQNQVWLCTDAGSVSLAP